LNSVASGPWLLIVDNADDIDVLFGKSGGGDGITQYLLEGEKALILFTTRLRDIAISVAGSYTIELSNMDNDKAMNFLGKLLFRGTFIDDKPTTHELLKELEYLPLAIT
jgi:hypothetical protein